MGWDALSSLCYNKGTEKQMKVFKDISKEVKDLTGCVDGLLQDGGLDISDSGEALEKITGNYVWSEYGYSKAEVQLFWSRNKHLWEPENRINQDDYYYWSALGFLKACAELNLSISFSW